MIAQLLLATVAGHTSILSYLLGHLDQVGMQLDRGGRSPLDWLADRLQRLKVVGMRFAGYTAEIRSCSEVRRGNGCGRQSRTASMFEWKLFS